MQFLQCVIAITLLSGLVGAQHEAETTEEHDARAGINDDLSGSITHPKVGDIPLLNRKIIKGQRVTIREYPFVASIRRKVSHYISGAILTNNVFVTVAHPLFNVPITELGVVLGENYSDRGTTIMTVVLTIFHGEFDPYTLRNDIVLLRTYEEASFRGAIKPIKLYPPATEVNGHKGFVVGWGRCDNMGTELCLGRSSKYFPQERLDPMLRIVSFDIIHPSPRCQDYKRYDITLHPGMLCLGQSREDEQACPCLGSPGALLVSETNLVGLQSWGYGCGYLYDLPLVYTEIYHYIAWILQNMIELRYLKQCNLTGLFQATRAAILSEWIAKTRVITPKLEIRSEKSMERLDIDVNLVKLNGSVYDIRDYISGGAYHAEKLALYESLMESEITKITKPTTTTPPMVLKPFLGEDAIDIGYKDDVSNGPTSPLTTTARIKPTKKHFFSTNDESDTGENTVSENVVNFK